jgi:PAS domain S-box-containing protein
MPTLAIDKSFIQIPSKPSRTQKRIKTPLSPAHPGRLFKKVCESLHGAVVIIDLSGKVIYANKAYYDLHGFSKEEIIGQDFTSIFSNHHQEDLIKYYKDFLTVGKIDNPVNASIQKKNGHIKHVEVCYNNVYKRRQKVAISLLIHDITNRVLAERKKDEYITFARHELKTPLATISAYFQLIQKYKTVSSSKKISTYCNTIQKEINRLNNLINEYLNSDNFMRDKSEYDLQLFHIDELILDCVSRVQVKTVKHKIIIESKKGIAVIADRLKIEQVCQNLLLNAIKYSPKADKIMVTIESNSRYLRVSITDFGIGIDKEQLEKVFQNYFRGHNVSTDSQTEGIGLYISKKIIRDHAGRMKVVSEIDKGSTFSFELPIGERSVN